MQLALRGEHGGPGSDGMFFVADPDLADTLDHIVDLVRVSVPMASLLLLRLETVEVTKEMIGGEEVVLLHLLGGERRTSVHVDEAFHGEEPPPPV